MPEELNFNNYHDFIPKPDLEDKMIRLVSMRDELELVKSHPTNNGFGGLLNESVDEFGELLLDRIYRALTLIDKGEPLPDDLSYNNLVERYGIWKGAVDHPIKNN